MGRMHIAPQTFDLFLPALQTSIFVELIHKTMYNIWWTPDTVIACQPQVVTALDIVRPLVSSDKSIHLFTYSEQAREAAAEELPPIWPIHNIVELSDLHDALVAVASRAFSRKRQAEWESEKKSNRVVYMWSSVRDAFSGAFWGIVGHRRSREVDGSESV